MIRVVIAEDQGMVLGALASLLTLETDIEVVARAPDGVAALHAVRSLRPDLLLSDIEMPGFTGLEVATQLAQERSSTRVLIVTTFGRAGYLRRAVDAGVCGYLLKDSPADRLADAIRRVASGGRVIDPELAATAAFAPPDPLTRSRARGFAPRPGRMLQQGDRALARTFPGHRAELPVRSRRQARRFQPDRGRPHCTGPRLALMPAAQARKCTLYVSTSSGDLWVGCWQNGELDPQTVIRGTPRAA